VDTFRAIVFIIFLFVVLPVCILWLRDRIVCGNGKRMPREQKEEIKRWVARLLNPQFDEVEKECGGFVPQGLRNLYGGKSRILLEDLEIVPPGKDPKKHSYWLATFVPMDLEGIRQTTDLSEFGQGCCFAGDGCGNFYWVRVSGERQADSPVYFACHDPYGNEKVADSLEEFCELVSCSPVKEKQGSNSGAALPMVAALKL
jgi:hypothetical protein